MFFLQFFCLLRTKILPFSCMMVKFGSIYYAGNMLIWHLCEYDTDILFTSAFKTGRTLQIYTDLSMGLAKKSIISSSLLFSGQSINQSIHMNIFFALRMFCEMRYRPYCLVIHQSTTYLLPNRVQSL